MRAGLSSYIIASLVTLVFTSPVVGAITLGQIDDFQDGTTQGWEAGLPSPVPPVNSTDNGPNGIGDHALLIATTGNGGGAGSRLVAFNTTQWTGDFTAAGVQSIMLEANNLSGRAVTLRLAADGGGGRFSTTTGFLLPGASGWQSLLFPITPGDWTDVGGVDINATLASVFDFRLVDSPVPSFRGDIGAAELLVDNITAVPEPSSLMLLACCVILCHRWFFDYSRFQSATVPNRPWIS